MFSHLSIPDRCARLRQMAECFPSDTMPDVRAFAFSTADVLASLGAQHARLVTLAAAAARSGDLEPLRRELSKTSPAE